MSEPKTEGGKIVAAGGWCQPLGDVYDLLEFSEGYKTIAQQIIEEDIKDGRPWALRGGIQYVCGTAARALAQMEVNDASTEGAAEPDERSR